MIAAAIARVGEAWVGGIASTRSGVARSSKTRGTGFGNWLSKHAVLAYDHYMRMLLTYATIHREVQEGFAMCVCAMLKVS